MMKYYQKTGYNFLLLVKERLKNGCIVLGQGKQYYLLVYLLLATT